MSTPFDTDKTEILNSKCRNKENHIKDSVNIKATPKTSQNSQKHLDNGQETCHKANSSSAAACIKAEYQQFIKYIDIEERWK
ncbi:hypothetical protein TNCT_530051 [Trichonephila clavata]|uniref:Uncharacterized protein n=1 Tax=Trichonephila clavata TaxID=2740835 RepID=A0A8X6EX38_TRICU|nr:hypothetical protein TNCT_530051 [Trichonephila clavata]